jgi:DNA-binding transcriptional ArsR family regulator
MNKRTADIAAGTVVLGIVLVGLVSSVQVYLSDGVMMEEMGSSPVIHIVGPLFASLVVASIIGSLYVVVRNRVIASEIDAVESSAGSLRGAEGEDEKTPGDAGSESDDGTIDPQIIAVLPEDERRILEPVIESPGVTQIEVRDRSGYSRSKVSQTITDLEKRGLLHREPQGRTYRVYPADDIEESV